MRAVTDLYMNKSSVGYAYNKTSKFCDTAENIPCWVPQIKDILDPEKSKLLKKCPTVWDFTCETNFLVYAWKYGPSMCPKPCKNWRFKSNDAGSSKMASYLGANVNYVMSFASDIVLREEERKVKPTKQITIKVFVQPSHSQQVMDVPTIVGSVGGSLGLFLGFSCLSSTLMILKRIFIKVDQGK